MGRSLISLSVETRSENTIGIKMYTALILEVKETIIFPQTVIPQILNQLLLWLANQLC